MKRTKLIISSICTTILVIGCSGGSSNSDSNTTQHSEKIEIVFPTSGSAVGTFPVVFRVDTDPSANLSVYRAELIDSDNLPIDITADFGRQPDGSLQAWYAALNPDIYRLNASIVDSRGETLTDSVTFTVPSKPDLTVPPGFTNPRPRPPRVGIPIDMSFPVRNQGTVDSGATTLDVTCVPISGAAAVLLDSIVIPPLPAAGEYPVQVDFAALGEPCTLITEVDPDDLVDESDEDNNSTEEEVQPPPSSDLDIAVHIETIASLVTQQTVQGVPRIQFQVRVANIGDSALQFPKLRFSLKDRQSGNYLGGDFGYLPGGGAGSCSPGGLSTEPVEVLGPLNVGDTRLLEYEAAWYSALSSGQVELCVEVIADSEASATSWNAQAEADNLANNADKLAWDMNLLGNFPSTGAVTVSKVEFFDAGDPHPADGGLPLASPDGTRILRLTLTSRTKTDPAGSVGLVSVGVEFTHLGGKDDGLAYASDWHLLEFIFPETYIEIPLPHNGPLPGTPLIEMTVTTTAGCTTPDYTTASCTDGADGPVVGSRTINLPVDYKDVRVEEILLFPAPPDTHTVPAGADPIEAVARIRNLGREPTTVDVGMSVTFTPSVSGATAELGPLPNSPQQAVNVPGDGYTDVTFPWSPTHPSVAGNNLDGYELTATVTPLEPQWPVSSTDNQKTVFFPVTQEPNLTVVTVNPKRARYNPSQPITLGINIYDHNYNPSSTFTLTILDKYPAGDVEVYTNSGVSLANRYDTVFADVTLTAGYHNLEIRANDTTLFTHPLDVAPYLDFTSALADSAPVYQSGRTHWRVSPNDDLDLFVLADQVITAVNSEGELGFDVSEQIGAQWRTFTVDDGTSGTEPYALTIRVPVRYVGVMQTANIAYGISDYGTAVGIGVTPLDPQNPARCWFCLESIAAQETIWDSGDSLPRIILGEAGEILVGKAAEKLTEKALIKKGIARGGAKVAGKIIGTGVELIFFTWGATNCDDDILAYENRDFDVTVENGKTYDLYLMLESRSRAWAIFGDTWSYVDFYDYYSSNCGGRRDGIRLFPVTDYWLQ